MRRPSPVDRVSLALPLLTAGWLALILLLTLVPAFGTGTAAGTAPSADAVRNALLFAPLGLLLGFSRRSMVRVALYAAFLSGGIEFAQHWIPGRHPGVRDIAMNTLGAGLGGAFARALWGPVFASAERSARLALAMGVLGAAVVLLPGILLRPAPPQSRYFTALRPNFPQYAVYPGAVVEASIGDRQIETNAPSPHSPALREGLLDGSQITVRAISRGRIEGLAPLVRINDGTWEVLMVGVSGNDLVVRRHAIAADLGFEEPLFRCSGVVPTSPGQRFRIDLLPSGAGWLATVDASPPQRMGPTPASARRLIADSDAFPESVQRALDALALFLLFGAITIWLRPSVPGLLGPLLPLLAMLLGPAIIGLVPAPPGEWLGVGLGLAAGGLVQAGLRRSRAPKGEGMATETQGPGP